VSVIWRLLASFAVPRKALERSWPRPSLTLWYIDYRMREILMPALERGIYGESPLLKNLRGLEPYLRGSAW
jgi:hypothetical protein